MKYITIYATSHIYILYLQPHYILRLMHMVCVMQYLNMIHIHLYSCQISVNSSTLRCLMWPSIIQVMICPLYFAKPLSRPIYNCRHTFHQKYPHLSNVLFFNNHAFSARPFVQRCLRYDKGWVWLMFSSASWSRKIRYGLSDWSHIWHSVLDGTKFT